MPSAYIDGEEIVFPNLIDADTGKVIRRPMPPEMAIEVLPGGSKGRIDTPEGVTSYFEERFKKFLHEDDKDTWNKNDVVVAAQKAFEELQKRMAYRCVPDNRVKLSIVYDVKSDGSAMPIYLNIGRPE